MKNKRLVVWIGIVSLIVLFAGLAYIGAKKSLNSGEWAAWVQAVGSVLAILVAVWVSNAQANEARQLHADLRRDEDTQRRSVVLAIAENAVDAFTDTAADIDKFIVLQTPSNSQMAPKVTNFRYAGVMRAIAEIRIGGLPTYNDVRATLSIRDSFDSMDRQVARAYLIAYNKPLQASVEVLILRGQIQELREIVNTIQSND